MRVLGTLLSRIAICCLPALWVSGAFSATPTETPVPAGSPATPAASHPAAPRTIYRVMSCPPGPIVIPLSKGRITGPAEDSLKAGRSVTVMISLYDGEIEAAAAADRQARHLTRDDAAVIQMETAAYKLLKAKVLSGYRPGDIQVMQDHPTLPDLTISIHDLRTLQALLDDPKVKGVFAGPIPACPA